MLLAGRENNRNQPADSYFELQSRITVSCLIVMAASKMSSNRVTLRVLFPADCAL